MALVINHNLMAMNAARNLGQVYDRLSTSTQRLSSGLRINSAADDAAGLAIRELMRSDIAVLNQGLRNAADGISMIQTAEGALSVIDEKLIRMKELAEQASTGTYTTVQRDIMNSEYQAMANEIDRIANATDFNGIKLLDGSITSQHAGEGLKIHFGAGNDSAEDYYFVKMGDARATVEGGLEVGGDAKNDIWGTAGAPGTGAAGCCGGGITSLTENANWASGAVFAYGYNHDLTQTDDTALDTGKYIGGMYQMGSAATLQDLVTAVNKGTQSRVQVDITGAANALTSAVSGAVRVCLGDEVYVFGSASLGDVTGKENYHVALTDSGASTMLASAIAASSTSFWALRSGTSVFVFNKEGGDNDDLLACEEGLGNAANSATVMDKVDWYNVETGVMSESGASFSLGGENWGTLQAVNTAGGSYGLTLTGEDVGVERDLTILDVSSAAAAPLNGFSTARAGDLNNIEGLGNASFSEIQNAADGPWKAAEIRTQSSAQEALEKLDDAIVKKDKIRADLGALQNRLENTMTNIQIQAEMLQAAESRISDVDVATEMTEFTRNNIMAQASTSMLAQANSLAQLALSLLG